MWELKYFNTGEWDVIQERLDDLDKASKLHASLYNPSRHLLFAALDATPLEKVKAVIVGQDPYPRPTVATGLAFSTVRGASKIPPTLANILTEYHNDLHYPYPKHGDLSSWAREGVLLINAIWSVGSKPLSHNWNEYRPLTQEVLTLCDNRGVPIVLLGGVARDFAGCIHNSPVLRLSHPSPRGVRFSKTPFLGSRMFTTINGLIGANPINWRLPDVYDK